MSVKIETDFAGAHMEDATNEGSNALKGGYQTPPIYKRDGSAPEVPRDPRDIAIQPPRGNLYADVVLRDGRTVSETLGEKGWRIPFKDQGSSVVQKGEKIEGGVEIRKHNVGYDHVPASDHELGGKVFKDDKGDKSNKF